MIRLVIADDHEVVRQSLHIGIEIQDDLQVVGEAANGKEAVDLCAALQPDLILMDLVMPVMDGVLATKLIRQRFPRIRILVLTSGVDHDLIKDAIAAGANAYLEKHIPIDVLTKTIWSLLA